MRSAARLLVVTLTGIIVALLPVHALAVPNPPAREYGLVAHQPTPPPTGPTTAPTTAPTVDLDPAETEEDRRETRRKLVMGIASIVLIAAVVWGRSLRRKKKTKG